MISIIFLISEYFAVYGWFLVAIFDKEVFEKFIHSVKSNNRLDFYSVDSGFYYITKFKVLVLEKRKKKGNKIGFIK